MTLLFLLQSARDCGNFSSGSRLRLTAICAQRPPCGIVPGADRQLLRTADEGSLRRDPAVQLWRRTVLGGQQQLDCGGVGSSAALRSRHQTQNAHPASHRGEYRTKRQCERGSLTTGEAKTECRKRCPGGLSGQACRRDHAARASTPVGRGAGHQGLHVRRLEKTKSTSADGHAPDDVDDVRVRRKHRQQGHPQAEQRKTDAAENPCGIAVG